MEGEHMELMDKLQVLTEGAKYDVACTSSGVGRNAVKGKIGSAKACGICHSFTPDGRCISLLKILMTNSCAYDCAYCVNRRSNDGPRASLAPREIAELTLDFYRRNYIEGLFLSSGVVKNPDYTMELLIDTLAIIRYEYHFYGYIHVKAIPGADEELIRRLGHLADRMSINIEMPSEKSLINTAPEKSKESILKPMGFVKNTIRQSKEELAIFKNAAQFVPAGQSTQMIVGASPESDSNIIHLSEGLYQKYNLKRVFYSAYIPVSNNLPMVAPPMLREHRLYQADWLLRFYGFSAKEIFTQSNENLSLHMDPKCHWALRNLHHFPVEINRADYMTLLRVPGIGQRSAEKIVSARRVGSLNFDNLKKIGVVLKRARYFITCNGKMQERIPTPEFLEYRLTDSKYTQLNLFEDQPLALPAKEA